MRKALILAGLLGLAPFIWLWWVVIASMVYARGMWAAIEEIVDGP